MGQIEGTNGKVCRHKRNCRKLDCACEHPDGRDIATDPASLICRFSRKCQRADCFYLHLAGRDVDEAGRACEQGRLCSKPECLLRHPDTRTFVTPLRCFSCGQGGHLRQDCPSNPREAAYVKIAGLPDDWFSQDNVVANVTAELEVFGSLSVRPTLCGREVFAAFADPELAKAAVKALGGVFQIELCAGKEKGRIVICGFPARWLSDDVSSFLRSVLKFKIPAQDVQVLPAEGDEGRAQVRFASELEAKRASAELVCQKVAGKSLTIRGESTKAPHTLTIHIDELAMPERPEREEATDVEVWADPLPQDTDLADLAKFGAVEEVFRVPDLVTGKPGDRGYVRFKEHGAAVKCIASGVGCWSESERLSRSNYPVVSNILGPNGDALKIIRDEIGAETLLLRGRDLGGCVDGLSSSRVHFICEGSEDVILGLQSALERRLAKIHAEISSKMSALTLPTLPAAPRKRPSRSASHRAKRRRHGHDRRSSEGPVPQSAGTWPGPPGPWMPPWGYPWMPGPWRPWPATPVPDPSKSLGSRSPARTAEEKSRWEGLSTSEFLAGLPEKLNTKEEALAKAVVSFLKAWAAKETRLPNLVHIGADANIRQCQAQALPRQVALKGWIEQRLRHAVAVVRDEKGRTNLRLA